MTFERQRNFLSWHDEITDRSTSLYLFLSNEQWIMCQINWFAKKDRWRLLQLLFLLKRSFPSSFFIGLAQW